MDALMRAAVLLLAMLAAVPCRSQERPAAMTEADLLRALLARDTSGARAAAASARAELARTARATAPSTSLLGRRESVSGDVEGSASVLGAGVSFDLSRSNALAREAAALDATAGLAAAEEAILDAACEVRSLAGDIESLELRIRALENEQARITTLREEAERRAAAGEEAPFEAEVLRAEESARDLYVPALRAAMAAARGALEAITGASTDRLALQEGSMLPPAESLIASVGEHHPRLRALRARAEAARSRTQLARASNATRLELFGGARTASEPGASGDGYEVEVGVTLPARSLRRHAVAEAIVVESDLDVEIVRAERAIHARLAAALGSWAALDEARRNRASAAGASLVEGSLRRYRAGEGSIAEVIQVLALARERILSDAELQAATRTARIELDCASGLLTAPDLLHVLEGSP